MFAIVLTLMVAAAPPAEEAEWLPPGATRRLGEGGLRHPGDIVRLAWSPDGTQIAGASYRTGVRVWDIRTGKVRLSFDAEWASGLAFSSDGKSLILAVNDAVRLHDVRTGRVTKRLAGDCSDLSEVALSADGSCVYFGSSARRECRNVVTGEVLPSSSFFANGATAVLGKAGNLSYARVVGVSPDGSAAWRVTTLVGPGPSGQIASQRFAVRTAEGCEVPIRGFDGDIHSREAATFSADGRLVTFAVGFGPAAFWDARSGAKFAFAPEARGMASAFSPDGRHFAVLSATTGAPVVRDVLTGRVLASMTGREPPIYPNNGPLVYSPDGRKIAYADGDRVRVWDSGSLDEIAYEHGNERPHRGDRFGGVENTEVHIGFAPDGSLLEKQAYSLRRWDVATGRAKRIVEPWNFNSRTAVSFAADRRLRDWYDGRLRVSTVVTDRQIADAPKGDLYRMVRLLADDGRTAVLARTPQKSKDAEGDTELTFADAVGRKILSTVAVRDFDAVRAAVSADGRRLVAAHLDRTVSLIDTRAGVVAARLHSPLSPGGGTDSYDVSRAAVSREGRFVAVAWQALPVRDNERRLFRPMVCLWDPDSGQPSAPRSWLSTEVGRIVTGIHFSPDGRSLALALAAPSRFSADPVAAAVRVLEVATGKERRRFEGHPTGADAVAFSADGRTLATIGRDATILVWDATGLADGTPPAVPAAREFPSLWDALASDDAPRAFDAVLRLAAAGKPAADFLAAKLRRGAVDAAKVDAWIAAADDESFAVRHRAVSSLIAAGEAARARVIAGMSGGSAERRDAMRRVLAALDRAAATPEGVREARAAEVLARIGVR